MATQPDSDHFYCSDKTEFYIFDRKGHSIFLCKKHAAVLALFGYELNKRIAEWQNANPNRPCEFDPNEEY